MLGIVYRPHTTVKNAKNLESISQTKPPYFEGIFKLWTHTVSDWYYAYLDMGAMRCRNYNLRNTNDPHFLKVLYLSKYIHENTKKNFFMKFRFMRFISFILTENLKMGLSPHLSLTGVCFHILCRQSNLGQNGCKCIMLT